MSARDTTGPVHGIGRREFVERSLSVVAGAPASMSVAALLAGCASLVTRTVTPVDGTLRLALAHYPELVEVGGSLKVAPEGTPEPIYILSLGEGQYAALSPICTHLGCTVEIEQARLVCPCHGSTYDRDGRVVRGPAEHALTSFKADLATDDVLVIDLKPRVGA